MPAVEGRIRKIRDQLVALGGLVPVEGTHDQVRAPCGQLHGRPMKFLMMQAVEKAPDYTLPEGRVKDLRSALNARLRRQGGRRPLALPRQR